MNLMFKCLECADIFKEIAMLTLIFSKTFGMLTLKATLLIPYSTQSELLTIKVAQVYHNVDSQSIKEVVMLTFTLPMLKDTLTV